MVTAAKSGGQIPKVAMGWAERGWLDLQVKGLDEIQGRRTSEQAYRQFSTPGLVTNAKDVTQWEIGKRKQKKKQ